jgi:hypothetical protein
MERDMKKNNTMNKSNLLLCTGLFINGCMIMVNRFVAEIPEIIFIPLALASTILIISSLVQTTGASRRRREHDGRQK